MILLRPLGRDSSYRATLSGAKKEPITTVTVLSGGLAAGAALQLRVMAEPIVLIGAGLRFPGGAETLSKLWSLIHQSRDLSREPSASRFRADAFYHLVGAHHGTTNAIKSYWLHNSDTTNVENFDLGFFNIQASEAEAMDPQHQLLLEVVYDGLGAAGQPMEKLRGSDTAVYVGVMCDGHNTMGDRPQFFQAHGTETQAGDPQEAEAIWTALFLLGSCMAREAEKLLVGSIKTIIRHTKGATIVASVITVLLAPR